MKRVLSKKLTLEAAFGRGVRSANMIERFINHFNVGQDPFEYIGNPDLKAEVNNQFEVGFKAKNNKKNSLKYSASVFYSDLNNFIVGVVDPSLKENLCQQLNLKTLKFFRI